MSTLTTDQRIKVCMAFLGYVEGLHVNLDEIRDGHDPRNPIDHNVEQAQIALENASMRIQQVVSHLHASMEPTA